MANRDDLIGRETAPLLAAGLVAGGISLVALLLYLQPLNEISIGVVLGTLFGQASLAAAWTALGPFRLIMRLPMSAAWIAAMVLLVAVGESHMPLQGLLIVGGAFTGQWLLVQMPLWTLVRIYGLRIAHGGDLKASPAADQQFGIGQLMILTGIVAVVLGAGRLLLGGFTWESDRGQGMEMVRSYCLIVVANARELRCRCWRPCCCRAG